MDELIERYKAARAGIAKVLQRQGLTAGERNIFISEYIQSSDALANALYNSQALRELQSLRRDHDKALSYVRFHDVPESRAKSLPQAVDVLVSRLQKEIRLSHHEAESLREENERLREDKQQRKDAAEKWTMDDKHDY